MGTVFRAMDRLHRNVVALKILHGRDDVDVERFMREAAILAELDHPGIVRYVAHGLTETGEHYLAMEWIEGEDLAARIARRPLSDAETLTAIGQAAAAVGFAHASGAIHRDIKPSNLFLRGADVARLAVVDFGIAGLTGDPRRLTQTGVLLGTPGYAAPEQVQGPPTLDPRSDVFSLGCVLFECLAGRPAFAGQNPMAVLAKLLLQEAPRLRDVRPDVAEPLDALVTRMLAKDPAARPQTLDEVAAEIAAIAAGCPLRAAPPPPASQPQIAPTSAEHRPRDVSSSEQSLSLTRNEQRLVTVVLAGRPEAEGKAGVSRWGLRAQTPASHTVERTLHARRSPRSTPRSPPGSRRGRAPRRAPHRARRRLAHHHRLGPRHRRRPGRARRALRARRARALHRPARLRRHRARPGRGPRRRGRRHRPRRAIPRRRARRRRAHRRGHRGRARRPLRGRARRRDLRAQGRHRGPRGAAPARQARRPASGRNRELAMLEGIFSGCVAEPVSSARAHHRARRRRQVAPQERARRQAPPRAATRSWSSTAAPTRSPPATPFGAIADLVRDAAGIRDGEPLYARRRSSPPGSRRRIEGPVLARVTAFLGEMVGTPFPDDGDAALRAARASAPS